ncbi:MAG: hypothetical protein ABSH28_09310, partial [Acidobacteriota bacterium]
NAQVLLTIIAVPAVKARLTPGAGRNHAEAGKPRVRLHADGSCAIRVYLRESASRKIRHRINEILY